MKVLYAIGIFAVLIGCSTAPPITGPTPKSSLPPIKLTEEEQASKDQCEQQGGKWYRSYGEIGNKCVLAYPDAGKRCTSSDQCEGDCVTNVISQLGKEGTCEKDNSGRNCFNPVENERFTCILDDVAIECSDERWNGRCDSLEGDLFFRT